MTTARKKKKVSKPKLLAAMCRVFWREHKDVLVAVLWFSGWFAAVPFIADHVTDDGKPASRPVQLVAALMVGPIMCGVVGGIAVGVVLMFFLNLFRMVRDFAIDLARQAQRDLGE